MAQQHENPFIERVRSMAALQDADLAALQKLLKQRRSVGVGRHVVQAGEPTDQLHILLDGWAYRYRVTAEGRRRVNAVFLPGDPCDLPGLLLGRQEGSVVAITNVKVAAVAHDALFAVCRKRPLLADMLLWLKTLDGAATTEPPSEARQRFARKELAQLICRIVLRQCASTPQSGESYFFPMTQRAIADTLALHSNIVSRAIQRLRDDGIINFERPRLTVSDWPALAALGEV